MKLLFVKLRLLRKITLLRNYAHLGRNYDVIDSLGWEGNSGQQKLESKADEFEKLWKRSTESREHEQESLQAVVAELEHAEETVNRLQ